MSIGRSSPPRICENRDVTFSARYALNTKGKSPECPLGTLDRREISKVLLRDALFCEMCDLVQSKAQLCTAVWMPETSQPHVVQFECAIEVRASPSTGCITETRRRLAARVAKVASSRNFYEGVLLPYLGTGASGCVEDVYVNDLRVALGSVGAQQRDVSHKSYPSEDRKYDKCNSPSLWHRQPLRFAPLSNLNTRATSRPRAYRSPSWGYWAPRADGAPRCRYSTSPKTQDRPYAKNNAHTRRLGESPRRASVRERSGNALHHRSTSPTTSGGVMSCESNLPFITYQNMSPTNRGKWDKDGIFAGEKKMRCDTRDPPSVSFYKGVTRNSKERESWRSPDSISAASAERPRGRPLSPPFQTRERNRKPQRNTLFSFGAHQTRGIPQTLDAAKVENKEIANVVPKSGRRVLYGSSCSPLSIHMLEDIPSKSPSNSVLLCEKLAFSPISKPTFFEDPKSSFTPVKKESHSPKTSPKSIEAETVKEVPLLQKSNVIQEKSLSVPQEEDEGLRLQTSSCLPSGCSPQPLLNTSLNQVSQKSPEPRLPRQKCSNDYSAGGLSVIRVTEAQLLSLSLRTPS